MRKFCVLIMTILLLSCMAFVGCANDNKKPNDDSGKPDVPPPTPPATVEKVLEFKDDRITIDSEDDIKLIESYNDFLDFSGAPELSYSTDIKKFGNGSIKVVNPSDERFSSDNSWPTISFEFDTPQDISNKKYIQVWIFNGDTENFVVDVQLLCDGSASVESNKRELNPGWNLVEITTLQLHNRTTNFAAITEIRIQTWGHAQYSSIYYIDDIVISNESAMDFSKDYTINTLNLGKYASGEKNLMTPAGLWVPAYTDQEGSLKFSQVDKGVLGVDFGAYQWSVLSLYSFNTNIGGYKKIYADIKNTSETAFDVGFNVQGGPNKDNFVRPSENMVMTKNLAPGATTTLCLDIDTLKGIFEGKGLTFDYMYYIEIYAGWDDATLVTDKKIEISNIYCTNNIKVASGSVVGFDSQDEIDNVASVWNVDGANQPILTLNTDNAYLKHGAGSMKVESKAQEGKNSGNSWPTVILEFNPVDMSKKEFVQFNLYNMGQAFSSIIEIYTTIDGNSGVGSRIKFAFNSGWNTVEVGTSTFAGDISGVKKICINPIGAHETVDIVYFIDDIILTDNSAMTGEGEYLVADFGKTDYSDANNYLQPITLLGGKNGTLTETGAHIQYKANESSWYTGMNANVLGYKSFVVTVKNLGEGEANINTKLFMDKPNGGGRTQIAEDFTIKAGETKDLVVYIEEMRTKLKDVKISTVIPGVEITAKNDCDVEIQNIRFNNDSKNPANLNIGFDSENDINEHITTWNVDGASIPTTTLNTDPAYIRSGNGSLKVASAPVEGFDVSNNWPQVIYQFEPNDFSKKAYFQVAIFNPSQDVFNVIVEIYSKVGGNVGVRRKPALNPGWNLVEIETASIAGDITGITKIVINPIGGHESKEIVYYIDDFKLSDTSIMGEQNKYVAVDFNKSAYSDKYNYLLPCENMGGPATRTQIDDGVTLGFNNVGDSIWYTNINGNVLAYNKMMVYVKNNSESDSQFNVRLFIDRKGSGRAESNIDVELAAGQSKTVELDITTIDIKDVQNIISTGFQITGNVVGEVTLQKVEFTK